MEKVSGENRGPVRSKVVASGRRELKKTPKENLGVTRKTL